MSEAKTYTRSDLIEAIYKASNVTRSDATLLFDTLLENIVKLLQETGEFKIAKFGSLNIRRKSERVGRNPKTGQEVLIPEHNAIVFKPSSALKAALEKSK